MIEEAIGDAAVRARKAGFDAMELWCVSGSSLHRFTNPTADIRTDQYFGNIENHPRIITKTLANIKKKAEDCFPVIYRITGVDKVPWGLGLEDWQKMASILNCYTIN
jgi:2,4-dienoyl-CoA reductase (NADPH2)